MDRVASFSLSKWYLDCIEPNGDGAVVYVVDLRWKEWHVRYASTLMFTQGQVETASSIREITLPECTSEQIVVTVPHLGLEGVWKPFAAPMQRTIFENSDGYISWECLQPASQVVLSLGGRKAAGLGYAELLRMSIPPWHLPLDELHWGRFVSESDSMVWIDWRGPYNRRLLLHNGAEREIGMINEDEVRSADSHASLTLDRGLQLRSGVLADTVFPSIRRLAKALPLKILRVNECKWRSRGRLLQAGHTTPGWVIHEVVKWPKE